MLGRRLLKYAIFVLFVGIVGVFAAQTESLAQAPTTEAQTEIQRPFSEASIKAEIERVENDRSINDETRQSIIELYDLAILRLLEGDSDKINASDFENRRESAPKDIEDFDNRISAIRDELGDTNNDPLAEFNELNLNQLEQQLASKVVDASSLRNAKNSDQSARTAMAQRPAQARAELAEILQGIETLNAQIEAFDAESSSSQEKAGHWLARATLYARQQRVLALEQEIASVQPQLGILDKRINLRDIEILKTEALIRALQVRTGTARTMNAEQQLGDARQSLQSVSERHPYVQEYARDNMNLVIQLVRMIESKENLPESEARIRAQLNQVGADANVTEQIILADGRVSQSYGAHLRELRQNQPLPGKIRAQISDRTSRLEDALFQRIVNQEKLQAFNAERVNFEEKIKLYDARIARLARSSDTPVRASLTSEEDYESLRNLQDYRRQYLNELAAFSAQRAAKLEEVNGLETKLLEDTLALCELLDGRLLWLPSTEAIGFNWPAKVATGVVQTFQPTTLSPIWKSITTGFKTNYFIAILALVLAGVVVVIRERLAPTMASMSKRVGRVQKDSYVLTPAAVLDGFLQVAPWALIPAAIGIMMIGTSNGNELVAASAKFFLFTSILILGFLTLREWCKKNALFDLHFNVHSELRHGLIRYIPMFLTTQIVGLLFLALTEGSFDFDSGSAALGVLGFVILSLAISYAAIKLYWSSENKRRHRARESDGIYVKNEKWFFLLALLVPVFTSLLALIGYYETGKLILWRSFVSFGILMTAYVVHGLLRRSVVIAQRRLALEQARRKRDQTIRERSEKEAAEGRGEVVMPKLDYEQIDLETINRQSSQIVNISVFLLTAGALWAVWANLLPALSVFNDYEFWGYYDVGPNGNFMLDDAGNKIRISFTLWNVMQAVAIIFITWLAGRNLPGFLDVFILKRMKIAQSTRFAIVTVLGYLIFIIGILIAFDKLGTRWSQLQWIVAALGVGIGFGLQEIIANFISGLIILFERPVRIGDYVTIGENSGTVTRIQIRATTLMDLDNKEILIPNKALVTERVTNWTLSNSVTRLKINVGIAYGSDTKAAHATILETVKSNANVLSNPEPSVLFLGFGDSSLDFEIRVFLRDFAQRFKVSHELHMAIDQSLREIGIEIPFPQRDLHIKNPDAQIVDEGKPKPRKKAKSKKKPASP